MHPNMTCDKDGWACERLSFLEAVEAINTLSVHDLKRHRELQDKALKWLYNKEHAAASKVTLPNGGRPDAIGYDESGHIIIVEVKKTFPGVGEPS